jgi:tetratricopeptide (TPR) repeat protein
MSWMDKAMRDNAKDHKKGMAAFNQGRFEEAARALSPAAGRGSVRGSLAGFYAGQSEFLMGLDAVSKREYAAAAEHLEAALGYGVGGLAASRHLAACHVALERYQDAAVVLEGLLGRDNDRAGVRLRLAQVHWQNGQEDLAMQCLEQGIEAQPDQAALHYELGTFRAAGGDYLGAAEAFSTAVRIDPDLVEGHVRLAWCHAALNRHDLAMESLRRACRLSPTDRHLSAQLALAGQAAAEGKAGIGRSLAYPVAALSLKDADLAQLAQRVADDPEFVEAFLLLPEPGVDAAVLELLAAALERAIQWHPAYADLHHYCSRVYERMGRSEEARAASERAVEINPRYIDAIVQMGRLFAATDRRREAIDRLEGVLQSGAEGADIHCVLGHLYRADGQVDRARVAYTRALDMNSGLQEARQALEALAA